MSFFSAAVAAATSGPLYDSSGGVNCSGNSGSLPQHGVVTATRSGNQLTLDVSYQSGDPNTTFSIEMFEAGSVCFPDNSGNTGVTLTSDASGNGAASFQLTLPYLTYTGDSFGAHLHFEIWEGPWYAGGEPTDPWPFLRRWDRWS